MSEAPRAPRPPAWRRYLRFWGPDVDADAKDERDFTALNHAASEGRLDVVEYLASRADVDVNADDTNANVSDDDLLGDLLGGLLD